MSNCDLTFHDGSKFDLWGEHLYSLKIKNAKLKIYLTNGICLAGSIRRFDKNNMLIVANDNNIGPMLISRSSIASIVQGHSKKHEHSPE
ncbi:hypothetical protein CWB96_00210 [Pseudoalteromonas citrea]|uniref:Uncharacterized protein n=1 Tax=Pseudoalteromonas citrea TaxID=43655 RepID=A0A5S3XX19_9GAMM|nr:RNA chaperone Hfq [Pseudoalteromonas citrea]TMP46289.1 hypothetical protein CWB97_02205 [Pseudoalteromonas citrea]TMP63065.1 hypothetical protein CWB96_00210 [Pseudoalteromonas citrea]